MKKGSSKQWYIDRKKAGLCTQCNNPRIPSTSRCSDCLHQKYLDAKKKDPDMGRKQHYKAAFGISLDDLDTMVEAQKGLCWICELPLDGDFSVDHDRQCCSERQTCGKCIRGVAHRLCNSRISGPFENPEFLRRLADKIENFKEEL